MGASDSGGRQTAKAEEEIAGTARSYRWHNNPTSNPQKLRL
jgi:hypothetical protein